MNSGRYTGFKDMLGARIFEGDLVKWDDAEGTRIAVAIFRNGHLYWHCIRNIPNNKNWAVGNEFEQGETFAYRDTKHFLKKVER